MAQSRKAAAEAERLRQNEDVTPECRARPGPVSQGQQPLDHRFMLGGR